MRLDKLMDDLVDQYREGNVVPILGCELLNINIPGEPVRNIHEYVINQHFKPSKNWPEEPGQLSELPFAIDKFNSTVLKEFHTDIQDSYKDIKLLSMIASLKNFKVFINATVFKEFV